MYDILIFDLDDTLTDDEANCREAFREMIKERNEEFTEDNFQLFRQIDKKTWDDRSKGILLTPYEDDNEKKKEWLRTSRIIKYYGENNITYSEAVKLNDIYIEGMKLHVVSRDGTEEVLKYLYNKGYKIVIATNGPLIPLKEKLNKLKIDMYVNTIFSAEEVGHMKPHDLYYEGLLKKANVKSTDKVLCIGDNLDTDVKGGIEHGFDTCWCNYNNEINEKYKINYEITKLTDLIEIL